MQKTILALACVLSSFAAQAQTPEDCANMANRWSSVFTTAPSHMDMARLFLPNALVFGTTSKELGTTAADVVAYFTPVYARAQRTKNVIKAQSAVQVTDSVWVIAGLYDFINLTADGTPAARAARFHFVVVREGTQCKIAAFNSSWVP